MPSQTVSNESCVALESQTGMESSNRHTPDILDDRQERNPKVQFRTTKFTVLGTKSASPSAGHGNRCSLPYFVAFLLLRHSASCAFRADRLTRPRSVSGCGRVFRAGQLHLERRRACNTDRL